MKKARLSKILSPTRIIALGFLLAILAGSLLLSLPFSVRDGVQLRYIDALYTSTSAVCVTGLIAVDSYDTFTPIGQFILGMLIQIWLRLLYRVGMYIENTWVAIYIFIIERKRIKKMPLHKKALYTLTWPTFDIIGRYTQYVALFKKVTWKPIPHESKVTIDDLNSDGISKENMSEKSSDKKTPQKA